MSPRPPIDGGVVVLTGASSGIGWEMARTLAPRAARLVLIARRRERLEALRDELCAAHPKLVVDVEPCDLSDLEAVDTLADRLLETGVDVLINNAGLGDVALFEVCDWDKQRRMLRVNVDALALLCHKLLPPMLARKKGGILNVSSGFGITPMPGMSMYVGTKHFVTAFTESLRIELAGTGIAVSQVCPGPVRTEFEDVAGNPTGKEVPALIQLSAAECASVALSGFSKGRALIVPGWWMRIALFWGSFTPRWAFRLAYAPFGRFLRGRVGTSPDPG